MLRKYKQQGSAIVTALMILAVGAAVMSLMLFRQRVDVYTTELMLNNDQMYLYTQGITGWAKDQLVNDALRARESEASVVDVMPMTMPSPDPKGYNNARIIGKITDQQSLLNINSLKNPNNKNALTNLLLAVVPKIKIQDAAAIAEATTQWLNPTSASANLVYQNAKLPYQAAAMPMASISEWRLVNGVTAEIYRAAAPYLAALPPSISAVNINTAPNAVIVTLFENPLTQDQLKALSKCRSENTNPNLSLGFQSCSIQLKLALRPTAQITNVSQYFLTQGSVTLGAQQLTVYSLLQRATDNNNTPVVYVVWQSRGTL